MDACQVLQGSGSGRLSDRRCFSAARVPLWPAHHPSARREGAFSSQQLLSFQLLLVNFPKPFPLAQELPAGGPRQSSKRGGLGKQPRRGAEKGPNLESKILRKTEAHTVQAYVGAAAPEPCRGPRGCGCREQRRNQHPTCQTVRTNETTGSEFTENLPSSSRLKDVSVNTCTHTHTLAAIHALTPLFHKENLYLLILPLLANPGRSKEWSPGGKRLKKTRYRQQHHLFTQQHSPSACSVPGLSREREETPGRARGHCPQSLSCAWRESPGSSHRGRQG